MASELQTRVNDGDVRAFLTSIDNEKSRKDSLTLLEIMQDFTGKTYQEVLCPNEKNTDP